MTENWVAASTAQSFNVLGYWNSFDAIWVIRMLDAKGANFGAFAQHRVAAHHDMFVDKGFVSPLLHAGVNLNRFAIGGGANKFGVDFQ